MEAPEKIYVDSNAIGENVSTSVLRKQFDSPSCVEYTRTDAFIEKACSILKDISCQFEIIEQFKNRIR